MHESMSIRGFARLTKEISAINPWGKALERTWTLETRLDTVIDEVLGQMTSSSPGCQDTLL